MFLRYLLCVSALALMAALPAAQQPPAAGAVEHTQALVERLAISSTEHHNAVQEYLAAIRRSLALSADQANKPCPTFASHLNTLITTQFTDVPTTTRLTATTTEEPVADSEGSTSEDEYPASTTELYQTTAPAGGEVGALCAASASSAEGEPADWATAQSAPAPDRLDQLMLNSTGCQYRALGAYAVLSSAEWRDTAGAGGLHILLAARTADWSYVGLAWNDTERYGIDLNEDAVRLWGDYFGKDSKLLWEVRVEGATDGRRYTPIHVAVEADRVTVRAACDPRRQFVIETRTAPGDTVSVRASSQHKKWSKLLVDCPLQH